LTIHRTSGFNHSVSRASNRFKRLWGMDAPMWPRIGALDPAVGVERRQEADHRKHPPMNEYSLRPDFAHALLGGIFGSPGHGRDFASYNRLVRS
jgi:hypothetical protein